MISVVVNGEVVELPGRSSVSDLLRTLSLERRVAAVEHNGDAVEPSRFAVVLLADGDRLEIVRAVAGG